MSLGQHYLPAAWLSACPAEAARLLAASVHLAHWNRRFHHHQVLAASPRFVSWMDPEPEGRAPHAGSPPVDRPAGSTAHRPSSDKRTTTYADRSTRQSAEPEALGTHRARSSDRPTAE